MLTNIKQYGMEANGIPFLTSVDEEGGMVARCADTIGTTGFNNMYTYREQGSETAYNNAYTIASDIAGLGFNLDFAPVADTWSNSANTVIGERAYSTDYTEASELVAAATKGFPPARAADGSPPRAMRSARRNRISWGRRSGPRRISASSLSSCPFT